MEREDKWLEKKKNWILEHIELLKDLLRNALEHNLLQRTCILAIVKKMNNWFQLIFKWACE